MEKTTKDQTITGKRVVVIGGTSGIGFAVAEAAANEGARVIIASRKQQSIDRALARLPEGTEGYAADVTDETAVKDLFEKVGSFDHLIFTAGDALQMKPLAELSTDEAQRFFETRYWGAFRAVKYAVDTMRRGGSIVLTSGSAAVRPAPGLITAASVTAAAESMARTLALELAPQGIRVNTVRPGPVRTPLWEGSTPNADELYGIFEKQLPVRRVGDPEEVAQAYIYLMNNSFTTGTVVTADGGHILV